MTESPFLARPLRTEAQATADRIRSRLTEHIAALAHAGALDREMAGELQAMVNATCMSARPTLEIVK